MALESEDLGQAAQAVQSDPSQQGPYGFCLAKRYYTRNSGPWVDEVYLARIRYAPSNGSCSQARPGPLVMLMRAKGSNYDYTEYDDIAKHLASHGYIVASLNLGDPAPVDIAAINLDFMHDYLLTEWSHASAIDTSRVGLVGHSRGAAAAMLMAEDLENDPTFDVDAIVSLAGKFEQVPTRTQTNGLLALHFTEDADVSAQSSAKYFEGPLSASYDRGLKLFEGGSHGHFLHEHSTEEATLTRGYLSAFLDYHLKGDDTYYDAYIRDGAPYDWTPGAVSSQFKERYGLTIDSFEDGTPGNNDLGGVVYRSGVNSEVRDLVQFQSSTVHYTNVMRVLAYSFDDHVTWRIPSQYANTAYYETLSFRIGQITGSTVSEDLTVQIRNGTTWSAEIPVTTGGQIGMPMSSCDDNQQTFACQNFSERDVMSTIRIPLSAFGSTNNVTRVRLRFRGDSIFKHFYVDDVAFQGLTYF